MRSRELLLKQMEEKCKGKKSQDKLIFGLIVLLVTILQMCLFLFHFFL